MALLDKLNQLYNEREAVYDKIAKKSQLSRTSFMCLYFIRMEKDEKTQAEIADDFFYPRQTINSAIQKLVNDNLVFLTIQKTKGHHKFVHLTEKGEEFCEKWIDPMIKADNESYLSLSTSDQEAFLRLYQSQLEVFKKSIKESNILEDNYE